MGEIVQLNDHRKNPTLAGPALCTVCKHEWTAIAPVGVTVLECPSCGLHRGYYRGFVNKPATALAYTCNYCEGQLFELHLEGVMCVGCGFEHGWDTVTEQTRG